MSILSSKRGRNDAVPQGIVALFFIQIVSTLSFSVLYSTLVLYMKGKLGLQVTTANSIMGVFIAFNFALHLLGGFWGGRLFSNRALFCIGMFAQVIGCFLLSLGGELFLYYGLAAFLTGSGLNVTCINCMLTQRFAPEDMRREAAFLWNYAGMNIGFFAGYTLSGVFQLTQSYERLFLLSSIGNLIALLICLFFWHQLADKGTSYSNLTRAVQQKANLWGMAFIVLLPFALHKMLQNAEWANKLVLVTGAAMLFIILYLAGQQDSKEAKDKMKAFAVLMIVSTIFWMLYQIGPMGLTVFIDYNVQRTYGNWVIPPQWFQNINTVIIVIGGPLMAYLFTKMRSRGVEINIPVQFSLALLFIGIAFGILPLGIFWANDHGLVNPSWVLASFILQSIGELLISPIGYAMIGYLAPGSLQGVMMGMWMLNTGVGATLSSYSSNWMVVNEQSTSPLITNSGYSQVFLMLGVFAIISSFILYCLIPKLKKLIQEKHSAHDVPSVKPVTEQVAVFE